MAATYSPERRTALVLTGTGADGAYQAGVLRALQEAGVKVDVLAGHGIGAASAAIGAIDGGAHLWDANGIWRSAQVTQLYRWKWPVAAAAWTVVVLLAVAAIPLLVAAASVIVFAVGLLLSMAGADAGAALVTSYADWLKVAFTGDGFATVVPRVTIVVLGVLVLVLAVGAALESWSPAARRRASGSWWWRVLGAPLDVAVVRERFVAVVWQLIRGAASLKRPAPAALGRRFAERIAENLGHPGFRELVLVATDLDARRDIVAALLKEPFRADFLAPRPGRERRSEVLDLAGVGRDHALDLLSAALTPPVVCDPHVVTFAGDSFWRGETHRLCDRPGAVHRLLEETAAAGVTQAIVVSAVPTAAAPHRLRPGRLDVRSRLAEFQASAGAAALRDALEMARLRFDSLYVISPAHNPIGPYDFGGAYDEASDRRHGLVESIERGYEDAYRQFIEPVVGASGEQLAYQETR